MTPPPLPLVALESGGEQGAAGHLVNGAVQVCDGTIDGPHPFPFGPDRYPVGRSCGAALGIGHCG
ncbi:MAG: hypothetical protein H0T72_00060 [Chloroflexia bacterium]|nr:hypothetical protein [Chloroflexia bacterium]